MHTSTEAARGREGDRDGLIADYTEALRLDHDFAEAYHARGVALTAKGDRAAAKRDYAAAERLRNK